MQINKAYYPYDSTLTPSGIQLTKAMSALPNLKINEEIDSSIFFVQNNNNPNLLLPTSSFIRRTKEVGAEINKINYVGNDTYNTLEAGYNTINPPLRTLFPDKRKTKIALSHFLGDINVNVKLGKSITSIPSQLSYAKPHITNNYKKTCVVVVLYCQRIPYGGTTKTFWSVSPYGYNEEMVNKVAEGVYPDIITAKQYNPITGIVGYLAYYDDIQKRWTKVTDGEGFLIDDINDKKNLYYLNNIGLFYTSSGALGQKLNTFSSSYRVDRTSSTGVEYTSNAGKSYTTYNTRDVKYCCGSIPDIEITDWVDGRLQFFYNSDNTINPNDGLYWQSYDYMYSTSKSTDLYPCWNLEGVKRYVASLGMFFTTKTLSDLTTDFSDIYNIPDYIHMPEITENGFTTGNYFSGREIGECKSQNKNWTSTTDSTIKPNDNNADGNDVEDLQFAQLNGSANNFIKSYILSYGELNSLAENFNNDNFVNPIPVGANPFANIISLKQYPFDISLPMVSMWRTEAIILDKWNTGISGKRLVSQNMLRQIGSYKIEKKYNSFLDYEPFTTAEIYVPMCGRANIPLNYIMGKTIIVYFASDLENGGCKAIVKCDEISAELSGTFSEDVSLTAENAGIRRLELAYAGSGFLASAVGAVASVGTGDSTGISYSSINGVKSLIDFANVNNGNYSVIKGESTPKVNFNNVPKCYVKISRPVIELPENYGRVNGFVVNKKLNLSNLNGYTICCNVDVDGLYCTENEKEMLKGIMESGFYI